MQNWVKGTWLGVKWATFEFWDPLRNSETDKATDLNLSEIGFGQMICNEVAEVRLYGDKKIYTE